MQDYAALLEKKLLPALLRKNNLFFDGFSNFCERSLPLPEIEAYAYPPNVQPCIALCLVLNGRLPLAINDHLISLHKDELMLQMPGTRSFIPFEPGMPAFRHMFIMFSGSHIRIHCSSLDRSSGRVTKKGFVNLRLEESIISGISVFNTIAGWPEAEAQYAFRGNLLNVVAMTLHALRDGAPWQENRQGLQTVLDNVQDYIKANYMLPLTLEGIADVFGFSPAYLSRSFKARYNMSLHRALLLRRLNSAEYLLTNGSAGVGEIAAACGFNSIQYFCQVFKAYYKVSPLAFREAYRCMTTNIL